MKYGVLKSITNTGADNELEYYFCAPLFVMNKYPVFAQDTLNLKRKVSTQNVQRWEIEATVSPTNTPADILVHTVVSNESSIIYTRMPQVYNLDFSANNITVNTNIVKNTDTFSILNASNMKKGEFISFSNHSKIYLVIDSGASGNNVKVFPKLLVDVPIGTSIITGGNVTMRGYYDGLQSGMLFTDGILMELGKIRIVEDI